MNLHKVSFCDAIEMIDRDLFLLLNNKQIQYKEYQQTESIMQTYSVKKREYNRAELVYWLKFGINIETLLKYNVVAIEEFSNTNKEGKIYSVRSNPDKFIFGYENGNWLKLYKPLDEKQYRFLYLGTKEQDYIFGWSQLPENADLIFITGGEKDVMTLAALGYIAISLNSETACLDKTIVDELRNRFNKIIILYDNDQTGLKQSQILSKTHNLNRIVLPYIPNNGKDISDFIEQGGTKETVDEWINNSLTENKSEEDIEDKVVYNAVELMAMGDLQPKYLMSPILPQKGTAVLAGKPDTGKSQFARQLCIQVALGLKSFIDFDINPIHSRSIYVATEDNLENTRYLMSRQMNGLNQEPKDNLRFIFADTMEQEEILKELDNQLTIAAADLVVVDSFGDIFKGGDTNNNMAMRNTVKIFDKIAKTHNCLILFVHHINKGAYRQAPGQEHIQGGAGLMQKVRLGIQLSEGENNTRYFTVVKGNYCPKEYKQNSIILEFSEETFLFKNTGRMIPTAELGNQPDTGKKEEKLNELENIAKDVFGDKIYNHKDYLRRYCEVTNKSVADANRKLNQFKKLELIVPCQGGYRLAIEVYETNSEEELEEAPF
jgi:KaiC/GvpD/RAD55 family RecA-like ATPase